MRLPASTDKEVMMREINEAEAALAEISRVIGCTCIIDPTETLGERVRHLGMIAALLQANVSSLSKVLNAQAVDKNLDELEEWFRNQNGGESV